jgi:hypothetical protein
LVIVAQEMRHVPLIQWLLDRLLGKPRQPITEIHAELWVTLDTQFWMRWPDRVAERRAQKEACARLTKIREAGISAVKAGRSGPEAMVGAFVEGR